jgi:hypothetical protein
MTRGLNYDPSICASQHSWGRQVYTTALSFLLVEMGSLDILPQLASNQYPPYLSLQCS